MTIRKLKESAEKITSKVFLYLGKTTGRFTPFHDDDLETAIEKGLGKTAMLVNWVVKRELSREYDDYGFFTVAGIAAKLKLAPSSVSLAIKECHDSELFFSIPLGNFGKLIFLNKDENKTLLLGIKKQDLKIEILGKHHIKIGGYPVKNFMIPSKSFGDTTQIFEGIELPESIVNTTTSDSPLEPPKEEPTIKEQSNQEGRKFDFDLNEILKNLTEEENTTLVKDNLTLAEEIKDTGNDNLSSNLTGSVTKMENNEGLGEEKNIPPAAAEPTPVHQIIEKLAVLGTGIKENIVLDLLKNNSVEILNTYLEAMPYFFEKYKVEHEKQTGFYLGAVKNKYPLPCAAATKDTLSDAQKEEVFNKKRDLKGLWQLLGLEGLPSLQVAKSFVSDFKNVFKDHDEIYQEAFEKNFGIYCDQDPEHAEEMAKRDGETAVKKAENRRGKFEKILAYFKINDDLNKYNYSSLLKKVNDKIDVQCAV